MSAANTIKASLAQVVRLAAVSDSARLDTELLLSHVLKQPRVYLYTWPEKALSPSQQKHFESLLQRRIAGEPVAYILGEKEFWSLPLQVNASTLIPRPETELLVETALALSAAKTAEIEPLRLLDLGTGSGAIALAFASERPQWQVLGVDKSAQALALAQANQQALQITNAAWRQSDWFCALAGQRFDFIVANPPYIAADDVHLTQGDLRFEPRTALVAAQQGLADLECIITQALSFMHPGACLLLEHGYQQADAVRTLLQAQGFQRCFSRHDISANERISGGYCGG
ncbi:MAG: peptide chain release factor N(5)-glutamine methyltransferase [Cellvibrionaceae bacterium]|nr:peptide chain release factor N(5)-glutamine methyltransferase [Cellvibrionaceae bacterium]